VGGRDRLRQEAARGIRDDIGNGAMSSQECSTAKVDMSAPHGPTCSARGGDALVRDLMHRFPGRHFVALTKDYMQSAG
jgi:hypothetical protein